MTNSIQQNVSTFIFKVNMGMSGINRDSQPDDSLLYNENFFRTLLDSLNSLSDELIKLDACLRENSLK
jgi:hypothetical protein